ncbi:importin-4-like [Catharus ustulatus]|uniref:importin-4-like n=1 Tax=Catharus ustulatus TaxID=91951 RepID=UPI00140BFB92|nr:importin-4-like [Catharus ustulatus]
MAAPTLFKMAAPALEQLLTELLEPDSAGIRQATARLREALEEPGTLEGLAVLLREAERPQVRNLAAVLLRRRLRKLPPGLIDRLPQLVVEALERDTDGSCRGSLGLLQARLLLQGGPEFREPIWKWIQGATREPQKLEGALRVLSVCISEAGPALFGHAPVSVSHAPSCGSPAPFSGPALLWLLRGSLRSPNPPGVVGAALGALGELLPLLGGTRKNLWRSLVPEVLQALQELLERDQERGAAALEILEQLLEFHPEALSSHLREMLGLCLQVGGAESRGDALRVRALGTVTATVQSRGRALLPLLPWLLRGVLGPLCAPLGSPPDPEDEDGAEGPSPRHAAAQILDALAQELPPEKLLKELLPLLEGPARGSCAGGRKGAMLALAAIAGGCGSALRQRFLAPVLGALRGGLGDPEGAVRGAAAAAMRELREQMEPHLAPLAAEFLPRVLGELWGSPQGWFVLEALLEALGEGAQAWLPQVLPRIQGALEAAEPRGRELALSALHALACSCESLPLPPPTLAAVAALAREGPHQLQALVPVHTGLYWSILVYTGVY